MSIDHPELARLLRETSRSFYLTLRLLPAPVRHQIGLAYLLARTSDTIADTELVSVDRRLSALGEYRDRIMGVRKEPLKLDGFLQSGAGAASEAERALLVRLEEALTILADLEAWDRAAIQEVLNVIISGQELDLRRFGAASLRRVTALGTASELDDYTFRVAGCVGRFWTVMCSRHLKLGWNEHVQLEDGVRFGKGLQLVNILRDLPKDLRQGRCYLPEDELRAAGLKPSDGLEAGCWDRMAAVYGVHWEVAKGHLEAGWRYASRIPSGEIRLRLACALPLLIGMRTLRMLQEGHPLDAGRRIKVSRGFVKLALVRALWAAWGFGRWEGLPGWAWRGGRGWG